MGSRWSNSIELLKSSWTVLRENRSLVWFPVVSSIATVILIAALALPAYFLTGVKDGQADKVMFYVFFFIFYLITSFIVIFFNTGLIACAKEAMHGGDPTFGYGMSVAAKNIGKILGWAAISATVGMVLKMIRERGGILGAIVSSIIAIAWNLITFFVIPVFVFQGLGVIASIKESAALFKKTWGENMIARFGLGIVFFLLALIGIVPIVLVAFTKSAALIILVSAVVLVYWAALAIMSASLTGILSMALYEYASTGQVPAAYNPQTIAGAFVPKPAKKGFGKR
jgi:hypothetical protein